MLSADRRWTFLDVGSTTLADPNPWNESDPPNPFELDPNFYLPNAFGDAVGSRPVLRFVGGPWDGHAVIQLEEDPPDEVRLPKRTATGRLAVDCYRLDPSDPRKVRLIYTGREVYEPE